MSSFTWLDSSEQERRQMLDIITLFREKETRDELGIGTVRDAFADLFFPGTSTIQTRARYFFFIPWIYLDLERRQVPSTKIAPSARHEEVHLINVLFDNGATNGLIGVHARRSLKRLPSAIYWQGLGAWGIRLFAGPQDSYHRSLDGFYAANRQVMHVHHENRDEEEFNELQLRQAYNWHPGVRELRPRNFPAEAAFALSRAEAYFLQERIISSRSGSLLAFLVAETKEKARTSFPWEHPAWASLPPYLQEQLDHARCFSLVMHGASLLYNLMLAEKVQASEGRSGHELVELYQEMLFTWAKQMQQEAAALGRWDWHNRFWEIVQLGTPYIPWRTRQFVTQWLRLTWQNNVEAIARQVEARQLVQQREHHLKGKLSRLFNSRSLELWNGASGIDRLNYRWGVAQTMLRDIGEGLSNA